MYQGVAYVMLLIGTVMSAYSPIRDCPTNSSPLQRLLLVDDDSELLNLLAKVLRQKGLQVATALSGDMAWEQYQASSFDLVVTDLNMENGNGNELLARIREQAPNQPLVAMSGSDQALSLAEHEHRLRNEVRIIFLRKPFDLSRFWMAMENAFIFSASASQNTSIIQT